VRLVAPAQQDLDLGIGGGDPGIEVDDRRRGLIGGERAGEVRVRIVEAALAVLRAGGDARGRRDARPVQAVVLPLPVSAAFAWRERTTWFGCLAGTRDRRRR
jgi:hypothetical protein